MAFMPTLFVLLFKGMMHLDFKCSGEGSKQLFLSVLVMDTYHSGLLVCYKLAVTFVTPSSINHVGTAVEL